jgi:hypothetical protein
MAQGQQIPPVRKPARTATTGGQPSRLPLPQVRRRIWIQACELVAVGEQRELSAVLANRFHTSERIIDTVLVSEGMRHERIAAALRNGLVNTLSIAHEASSAFDTEISDVA